MNVPEKVFNNFRQAYFHSGLTLEEFGEVLECSHSNASKKVNGKISITIMDLLNLIDKLNISPLFALGYSDNETKESFIMKLKNKN